MIDSLNTLELVLAALTLMAVFYKGYRYVVRLVRRASVRRFIRLHSGYTTQAGARVLPQKAHAPQTQNVRPVHDVAHSLPFLRPLNDESGMTTVRLTIPMKDGAA